jgi:hypothetical protein
MGKNETKIFDLIIKYGPTLIDMAQSAWDWIKGRKTGAEKKAFVTDSLKNITSVIASESTGGAEKTWEKIGPSVSKYIDATVELANAAGVFESSVDENAKISMG